MRRRAPTRTVSVADVSLAEGDSGSPVLTATVSLSTPATSTVSAKLSTIAGTATAGNDYTAVLNQTVTFAAGNIAKSVAIPLRNDLTVEANETFTLSLASLQGVGRWKDERAGHDRRQRQRAPDRADRRHRGIEPDPVGRRRGQVDRVDDTPVTATDHRQSVPGVDECRCQLGRVDCRQERGPGRSSSTRAARE